MLEVSDEDDVDDSCRLATVPKERYQRSRDLLWLALVPRRFACIKQGRVWSTFIEHVSKGFQTSQRTGIEWDAARHSHRGVWAGDLKYQISDY